MSETKHPQRITRFEANNVKRIKAVSITPDGNLVILGGDNDQGKSSILDSICMALGGKNFVPEVPIRTGQSKAQIVIETEELIVTRKFSVAGGTSLVVTTRDGMQISSPQALLDKMIGGKLSFDPLAFSAMTEKEPIKALELLRKLVGLDFTALDARRKTVYDNRTLKNRELDTLNAQLPATLPDFTGVPDAEIDVSELVEQARTANETNLKNVSARQRLTIAANADVLAAENKLSASAYQVKSLKERIAELEEELAVKREHLGVRLTERDEAEKQVSAAKDRAAIASQEVEKIVDVDTNAISLQIQTADATNAKVRAKKSLAKLREDIRTCSLASEKMTTEIESIDAEKAKLLADTKFPIPEISFGDTGVLLNGLPFAQGSTAVKIRASMAIGLAMNPELRVILIKDGSMLDENSLKIVAEMAAEANAQVWMERVSKGKECQYIITDGCVEGAE